LSYAQFNPTQCLAYSSTTKNGITFALVVNDFGIKFLTTAGRAHVDVTADAQYLGITIKHDKGHIQSVAI
jgi:hypothetical protein